MDENDNNNHNAEETNNQTVCVEMKIESAVLSKPVNHDGAGPSNPLPPLPGTVDKIIQKSKSEHNLRHIITDEDLARALKSISFNPNQDNCLKEQLTQRAQTETSFIDIKKFMASCFHLKDQINNNIIIELPNVPCNDLPRDQVFEPKTDVKSNEQLKGDKQRNSGTFSVKSDLICPRDSMSSIGSNVCRICMTKGKERLISPCNCKGSLANVHLSCLERWLNQVGRNHCELCGYSYPATRTPRYTVLQALRLWFGNPRNRNHLQSDCLIFWLLSTVTAGLLAVCIVGTQYFVVEGNKFSKLDVRTRKEEVEIGNEIIGTKRISHRITETAMNFFMAIVLCGYSVTVYLLWKDHYVMWNRWRRANVNVRLLLTPDSNPVPFVPRPRYSRV